MSRIWSACAAASLALGMLSGAPGVLAAEEETVGNNLSYPVLWAEGPSQWRPVPPGVMGEETFGNVVAGTLSPDDPTPCLAAIQKDASNLWQADNAEIAGNPVTHVDWGDNLEAKDWSVGAKVRVETVLFDNALEETMTGYEMCYVSGAMSQDELWGARVEAGVGATDDVMPSVTAYNAVLTEDSSATIYSDGGRLTIQRITDPQAATWSADEHRWVGAGTTAPLFNAAVHEKVSDGPGNYGAELNVKGKVIYGMQWDTAGLYNGEYRLTFSLDGAIGDFAGSGTDLNSASILVPVEDEIAAVLEAEAAAGRGPGGGGGGGEDAANTAVVAGGVTYIDVALSGGEDAPVAPTDPGDDPAAPPAAGGGSAAGPDTGDVPESAAPQTSSDPQAGQPEQVSVPQAATTLIGQRARLGLPKSGTKFTVGQKVVLARKPVKTTAGVTVRWKVTAASEDNCSITKRDGRVTLTMLKPERCTVVAWAPAASSDYQKYRKAFTYRIGW